MRRCPKRRKSTRPNGRVISKTLRNSDSIRSGSFSAGTESSVNRGKRDFSRIDLAFDLAARNHLRVIVNVGGTFTNLQAIYPPRHLVYDEHCTLLKPKPDSDEELRFTGSSSVTTIHAIRNSPGNFCTRRSPDTRTGRNFSPGPAGTNRASRSVTRRHTVALYRKWLERKYGDLETLAKAWSTEFPVRFRTWEDVNPQPEANFEAGGYAPFLDWQKFLAENRTPNSTSCGAGIREVDPVTPVISHLCEPSDADIFGEEEILGTSVYTIHAQGKSATGFSPYEFVSRQNLPFITEGRRRERRDPEGFWVVETEAGPVSWVHRSRAAELLAATDECARSLLHGSRRARHSALALPQPDLRRAGGGIQPRRLGRTDHENVRKSSVDSPGSCRKTRRFSPRIRRSFPESQSSIRATATPSRSPRVTAGGTTMPS